jgi:hypothetical protein
MIPFCFKQVGGDIDPTFQFTTTLQEYAAIRLRENLSFFLGEWFLDTRAGLPYFRVIIGQRYDPAAIDSMFRRGALLSPGVAAVEALTSSFNRKTRVLAIPTFQIRLKDGSLITQDQLQIPYVVTAQGDSNAAP